MTTPNTHTPGTTSLTKDIETPPVHLTALSVTPHTSDNIKRGDMNALARLCGHSPQQTAELPDRLVASQALAGWQHGWETDEAFWQLAAGALAGH
ncbi:hypothetical protein [Streptomyces sp. NPDC058625]|uniref:hypothetical protein n=1 Tax=Streptomyces sp. NPDC058625 TaxID=3346564 RepID=UPI00364CF401